MDDVRIFDGVMAEIRLLTVGVHAVEVTVGVHAVTELKVESLK